MDASDLTTGPAAGTPPGRDAKPPKAVEVVVNKTKLSITMGEHTGLEIKQAAIAQGAVLELDFVLSVERGNHYVTVADGDIVKVHAALDFLAVAGDDNS